VEAAADKVARVTDGVLKMDAALAALAVGGLTYAYVKSVDFEGAMIDLAKVVGADNVEALERAKATALELSETYGIAAKDIVEAMAGFAQSGYDIEEAMLLASNAMKLSAVGGLDAARSADVLIRTLAGLGEEAEYSTKIIELLNWAENNFATNTSLLAEALARSAPLASAYGMSLQEMAAILVPMIEVFQNAELAATAFKSGLIRLKDDSGPVVEAFKLLGFTQEEIINRTMMSTKDILFMVAERFQGLDENMKGVVAEAIFGKEQFAKMLAVLENMDKVTKVLDADMGTMADTLAQELAVKLAAAEKQVEIFKASFSNLAIVVGDQFRVAATEAISGSSEIVQALRAAVQDGAFDEIFGWIERFAEEIGQYLSDVAKALPGVLEDFDWSGFLDALDELKDAFGGLFGDLDLRKPEDLKTALENLVSIIEGVIRVTTGMVEAFKPYLKQVADFFIELSKGDEQAQEFAGQMLVHAKVIAMAGLEFAAVLVAMQETGTSVKDALDIVAGAIQMVWNTIEVAVKSALLWYINAAEKVLQLWDMVTLGTLDGIESSLQKVRALKDTLTASIGEDFDDLAAGAGKVAGGIASIGAAGEAAAHGAKYLGSEIGEAGQEIKRFAIEADGAGEAIDQIPGEKKTEFTAIGFSEAVEKIQAVGASITDIPVEKIIALAVASDQASFDAAWADIQQYLPDEKKVNVGAEADQPSLDAVGNALDDKSKPRTAPYTGKTDPVNLTTEGNKLDNLAAPRTANIEAKTDEVALARVKGQFEVIQSAIEWKAKLDISEVEANAKIVEALADTLGESFAAAGEAISGLAGALDPELSRGEWTNILARIDEQIAIQERSLELTESLVNKQVEFMQAKIDAMKAGEALIQIDGAGLQPHLEAFMWEILSAVQVRVNEEGHAMLFGL